MAPQVSQICAGNFAKSKKSVAELFQIIYMVTVEIEMMHCPAWDDSFDFCGC